MSARQGDSLRGLCVCRRFCLCLAGIPIGLATGYGCGVLVSPALTADLDRIGHPQEAVVGASLFVFIAAAVFALVTVYLSCIQACRMVARLSPIEALRIAEGGQSGVKSPAGKDAQEEL